MRKGYPDSIRIGEYMGDKRKSGLPKPFEHKVWLSSPTMHGEEMDYMREAYDTNWMSTVGANIDAIEKTMAARIGVGYGVALSTGTAALHMAVRAAGVRPGDLVLCSDTTFSATANPIVYEGGVPVFVDSERDSWNMDPAALEKAFELYPEARVVMTVSLYGVPGRLDEIRDICDRHGAVMIEDAAEALGSVYHGKMAGSFGHYNVISFNGNKIITGSCGGMLLTDDRCAAEKVRKWSTQSREAAPWYQHEELGFNYRMSNVVAGIIRGQEKHLEEHIAQKQAIWERYREGFRDLPVTMNPRLPDSIPNCWLSCMLIDEDAMCRQVRSEREALYVAEPGKTCPTEILETLAACNAEGRPVWKPMHMQPFFIANPFVTREGNARATTNAYRPGGMSDVGSDLFRRGLCLPSDNKMTPDVQNRIIEIVRSCF